MLKGLLSKLSGKEEDVNLGPVNFIVCLQEGANREEVETELKKRGIKPYNFLESFGMLFCSSPKRVYEEVFNAKLVRGDPKKVFGNTIGGYAEKQKPSIPAYLEGKVSGVELDTVCVGTPESIAKYHS